LTQLYEGMFLLDNQVVREDWKRAKAIVTDTLSKHGAKVVCARRWDERRLAYSIRQRHRATYCLAFYAMGNEGIAALRRELDLSESVMRYLIMGIDAVPDGEIDRAGQEDAAGFSVPPPPPDDAPEPEPERPRRREEVEVEVPDLEEIPAVGDDDSAPVPARARKPEAKPSGTGV